MKSYNVHYHRSSKGRGKWKFFNLPKQWEIHYKNKLVLNLKPSNFKHTGLFTEQVATWDWILKNRERKTEAVISRSNRINDLFKSLEFYIK